MSENSGPLDIYDTHPRLFAPRPPMIENTKALIDPATGEVVIVTEVARRQFEWDQLKLPEVYHDPEFTELLKMHRQGADAERMVRRYWFGFGIFTPLMLACVAAAVVAGFFHSWWLMGSAILGAIGFGLLLAMVVMGHDEAKLEIEVERAQRRSSGRARHRAE